MTVGVHVDAHKCVACKVGHACVKEGGGLPCIAGYVHNGEEAGPCEACEKGKYSDNTGQSGCKSCPKGLYSDVRQAQNCKRCPIGWATNMNPTGPCEHCRQGFKYTNVNLAPDYGKCVICPQGWEGLPPTHSTGSDCRACPKQEYSDQTGKLDCKWCPKGYDTRDKTGQKLCTKCLEGKYRETARDNDWWSCPSGWYSKAGATACKKCPFNTWTRDQRGWSRCLVIVTVGGPKYQYYP